MTIFRRISRQTGQFTSAASLNRTLSAFATRVLVDDAIPSTAPMSNGKGTILVSGQGKKIPTSGAEMLRQILHIYFYNRHEEQARRFKYSRRLSQQPSAG